MIIVENAAFRGSLLTLMSSFKAVALQSYSLPFRAEFPPRFQDARGAIYAQGTAHGTRQEAKDAHDGIVRSSPISKVSRVGLPVSQSRGTNHMVNGYRPGGGCSDLNHGIRRPAPRSGSWGECLLMPFPLLNFVKVLRIRHHDEVGLLRRLE